MAERVKTFPIFVVILAILIFGFLLIFILSLDTFNPSGLPRPISLSSANVGFAGLYQLLAQSQSKAYRQEKANLNSFKKPFYILTGEKPLQLPPEPNFIAAVILPKWEFLPDSKNRSWAAFLRPMDLKKVAQSLLLTKQENAKLNPEDLSVIESFLKNTVILPSSLPLSVSSFKSPDPIFSYGPPQLLKPSSNLLPIVSTFGGLILVGRLNLQIGTFYFISDPDCLNNMGLSQGQNPSWSLSLFNHIRNESKAEGPYFFLDPPSQRANARSKKSESSLSSFFGSLFDSPFFVLTALTIVTALLFFLSGQGRLESFERPMITTVFGKLKLINNCSSLLARIGHLNFILENYFWLIARLSAKSLNAPKGLNKKDTLNWLTKISKIKGFKIDLQLLATKAGQADKAKMNLSAAETLYLAQKIYHWKEELESGPRPHSRRGQ